MLRLKRPILALAATLGLLSFATPAAAQSGAQWAPNEDDSLLFEVRLGQYSLGDSVRGYQTPDGTCVNFRDMVAALDIAVEVDEAKGVAEGWAFDERNRIRIDRPAGQVRLAQGKQAIDGTAVRDTPNGWCISAASLSSWLGIQLVPDLQSAIIILKSKTKLPVELAAERRVRASKVRPTAQVDLRKLPQAKLPYRMWRTPSLDAVVTVGGLSDKVQGRRIDREYQLYASGEIAKLSFDARLSSDKRGAPTDFRMRAYRSDVDGGLLGPLGATHFEIGDVSSYSSPIVAQSGTGRGFSVTNRPIDRPETFDRKTFRGELPTGWDAELYRNGQLLAVAQPRTDGRYEFLDVPLLFGINRIEIVLYGPQGQVRRDYDTINVGAESIPPRETWYWANISENERDLLSIGPYHIDQNRGWRGTFGVERGLDQRTSISAQVHSLVIDDERLTFVEGAVRRSIGPALVELGGAFEKSGGYAARAQVLGQFGETNFTSETVVARNFQSGRVEKNVVFSQALALDHHFDLGKLSLPVHLEGRYFERENGSRVFDSQSRISATISRFSITAAVDTRLQKEAHGPDPPALVEAALLTSGTIGKTRLRGELRWRLKPENQFYSASIIGERRLDDRSALRGEIGYDRGLDRVRGGFGYIRQFDKFALSLVGEAASDGSVAAGLNLALSLGPDPRGGGIRVTSNKLAANGSVLARVFRDENGDGFRGPGENYERDVQLMVARRPTEKLTDGRGEVIIDGLEPNLPVQLAIDASSLPDPFVQPAGLGVG
jgi:hypothetical protein